jgi:NADH-quinone oxidoreductase subunit G
VDLGQDPPHRRRPATQRLDRPYLREERPLRPASWNEAFAAIANAGEGTRAREKIGAIAGDLAAVEEMFALKALMASLGSAKLDCRQDGTHSILPLAARATSSIPRSQGIEEAPTRC